MAWVAADTGGAALVSLASILFIARLLGPEEFGIAALAVGLVQIANLYAEGLFHDALIQRRDVGAEHFRQAWWMSLLVGLALLTAFGLFAWVVRGQAIERVAAGAALAATSLPLGGLVGVGNARLRREMQFDTVAIASVTSKLVSAVCAVALAWLGAGAMALILQCALAPLLNLVVQTGRTRWIPAPVFQFPALKPFWGFVLPYAMMHTVAGGRAQAFIGAAAVVANLAVAGALSAAFRLTLTPLYLLTTALTNYVLPILARDQDDRERVVTSYLELTRLVVLATAPAFIGLAVVADPLVRVVLGETWLSSIFPLQLFALAAAIQLIRFTGSILLRALGHVRFSFTNALVHFGVTLGGITLCRPTSPDLLGLLWLLPTLHLLPTTILVLRYRLGIPLKAQLAAVAPGLLASSLMVVVMATVNWIIGVEPPSVRLVITIACGAVAYAIAALCLEPRLRKLLNGFQSFRRGHGSAPSNR